MLEVSATKIEKLQCSGHLDLMISILIRSDPIAGNAPDRAVFSQQQIESGSVPQGFFFRRIPATVTRN